MTADSTRAAGAPPAFVVGFPRSGTTLLQALIGAHPDIAAPPEMHFFRRVARVRDYWGDLNDDDALRRVIDATLNPPSGMLSESGFDADRIFARARTGPRTFPAILDAVMTDFAAHHGKTRWCEKTPLQHPMVIWRAFPDAQLIHIIRDPRATVASAKSKLGIFGGAGATARLWLQFTEEASQLGADRGAAQYLRIRYEDLTRHPDAVMRLVFSFLGEHFDPAMLHDTEARRATVTSQAAPWQSKALQPIQAPATDAWRAQLTRQERLRTAAVVGGVLSVLGYPPARRATRTVGAAINAVHAPIDAYRVGRAQRRIKRAKTPEERFKESLRLQEDMLGQMERTVSKSGSQG